MGTWGLLPRPPAACSAPCSSRSPSPCVASLGNCSTYFEPCTSAPFLPVSTPTQA